MNIASGDVVTENLKNNCRNIIHDYFADKGYYSVVTEIEEKKDTNTLRNEAFLTFKIDKHLIQRIQPTDSKIRHIITP